MLIILRKFVHFGEQILKHNTSGQTRAVQIQFQGFMARNGGGVDVCKQNVGDGEF